MLSNKAGGEGRPRPELQGAGGVQRVLSCWGVCEVTTLRS